MEMDLHGLLIEILRFPLDDFQGALRAFAQTGPQSIAVFFGSKLGLAVYDLNRSFGAGGHAFPAAVAFLFVDLNDFPFDFHFSFL
jgi:hypothetical protein